MFFGCRRDLELYVIINTRPSTRSISFIIVQRGRGAARLAPAANIGSSLERVHPDRATGPAAWLAFLARPL